MKLPRYPFNGLILLRNGYLNFKGNTVKIEPVTLKRKISHQSEIPTVTYFGHQWEAYQLTSICSSVASHTDRFDQLINNSSVGRKNLDQWQVECISGKTDTSMGVQCISGKTNASVGLMLQWENLSISGKIVNQWEYCC